MRIGFNDVNRLHYTILGDPANAAAALSPLVNNSTEDTAPDKIADFLGSYDASAATGKKLRLVTAMARAMPFGQGLLVNGKIVPSVGSNALTIAVKGDDGNDPSATNPVYVLFRKASLTDSGFDLVPITAALSLVISSGSTLGHASAIAQHIFVYLLNNAGAAELAASNLPPDYPGVFGKARLVSTTAEGGAGAADSATGVYSTTARSNVPWTCVAKMLSTQTTAGTWAAAITQIDQAPFVIPDCRVHVKRSGTQLIAHNTVTTVSLDTERYDPDGVFDTSTYRYQPNVAGVYDLGPLHEYSDLVTGAVQISIAHTNTDYNKALTEAGTNNNGGQAFKMEAVFNGTSDYCVMQTYQAHGSNRNLSANSCFSASRVRGE